ncbi:MAG: molecular chaperone DnaJ [Jatrophihabitans sp.]|uniref:molecular chaperone DnaJ n=1 Tax=Jatrophihabitans sp. TaxID=1932789 RepID=UPI003F8168C8
MTARYTVRPISDRTWFRPPEQRIYSPFSASWGETLGDLIREVYALQEQGMPDPVVEVDVRERDIRVDGELRADAKASSPAVVVAFESIHGPLLYRCDRYVRGPVDRHRRLADWQHNVRAIAKTLKALRAVDRYGATRRAEQYQGFRALPAGSGAAPSGMTDEMAAAVLLKEAGVEEFGENGGIAGVLRRAKAHAHPDRNNGDRSRWDAVEQAEQVLRRAGRL